MPNLIIFDIDGTLIQYIDCEDKAYTQAVTSTTGIKELKIAWETYNYSTDAGVLAEITEYAFSREPHADEIATIKNKFLSYLSNVFKNDPCQSIAGAKTIFSQIKNMNWDIAIATGAWQESAFMKLQTAAIPHEQIPLAHSDDHYDRKDIIMTAVERAKNFYGKRSYQNIIYVGDALWDLKAALDLKINFIGIGKNFDSLSPTNFFRIPHYEDTSLLEYLKKFN